MLRLMFVLAMVGVMLLTGCGLGNPCPQMTAQEYQAMVGIMTLYAQGAKASGMSREQFLSEVDRLSDQCEVYGFLEGMPSGLPLDLVTDACDCMISTMTAVANDVW